MSNKRVLSVGQCLADHSTLKRWLGERFAAVVVPLDSCDEAIECLRRERFDLVLVNRIFDATGETGLELIRRLRAETELSSVPVMLVSNFADAQAEAVAAGAVPGFGKAALHHPETVERLRPFLATDFA